MDKEQVKRNQEFDVKLLQNRENPKVREQLVLKYAPLVKWVINSLSLYLPPSIDEEDLISIGTLGLLEAIDKYKIGSKMQFKTYATMVIKRYIIDELRRLDFASRSARKRVREIERMYAKLEQKLERPATDEEVAQALGIKVEDIYRAFSKVSGGIISLDSAVYQEEDNSPSISTIIAEEEKDILDELVEEEIHEELVKAIKELPERERTIIILYYYEKLTRKEIGEILGITEVRVFQLHMRALMRLRGKLQEKFGFG